MEDNQKNNDSERGNKIEASRLSKETVWGAEASSPGHTPSVDENKECVSDTTEVAQQADLQIGQHSLSDALYSADTPTVAGVDHDEISPVEFSAVKSEAPRDIERATDIIAGVEHALDESASQWELLNK